MEESSSENDLTMSIEAMEENLINLSLGNRHVFEDLISNFKLDQWRNLHDKGKKNK